MIVDELILDVDAGGIFSKFMFVIQNLQKINSNFKSVYVNNIDNRSRIGFENIFDSILEQKLDKNLPVIKCEHLGNYSNNSPIELSPRIDEYKKIISKLKLNRELIKKFDFYYNRYKINEKYLGVHIRLCDINIYHPEYGSITYNDYLVKIKEEKDKDTKIFVSSDNNESIKKIKKEFGDDVIFVEDFLRADTENENSFYLQLNHFKSIKFWHDCFIEMLLLSKCGKLICSSSNLNNTSILYSDSIKKIIRI